MRGGVGGVRGGEGWEELHLCIVHVIEVCCIISILPLLSNRENCYLIG